MSERGMLLEHGTEAFRLTSGAIITAAERDLRTARENDRKNRLRRDLREAERFVDADAVPPNRGYCFLARHIRRAKCPEGILKLAIDEIGECAASAKYNLRLIASDRGLLEEAYNEALRRAEACERS